MTDTSHFLTKLVAAGLLTAQVAAHGYVQGIVADGTYYQGYRPSFQYQTSPPQVPGWSDPKNLDNGFISDYTSPDIICHVGATPGQTYATVQAGGSVELQWTPWPVGHLGPVLTYLANCNGECTTVDKTQLLFNKINEEGLIQGGSSPGKWAVDELVANNNSWTLTIPATIAPGNYVLRHEIIALQQAMTVGGAQNYPQCVNIKVTGSGTNSLQSGTLGTQLYTAQDPGILIDIYQSLSNYTIPGPALISGASSAAQPNATSVPTSTSTAAATTSFSVTTSTSTTIFGQGTSVSTLFTTTTSTSTTSFGLATSVTTSFTAATTTSTSVIGQFTTISTTSSTTTSSVSATLTDFSTTPFVVATTSSSTSTTSDGGAFFNTFPTPFTSGFFNPFPSTFSTFTRPAADSVPTGSGVFTYTRGWGGRPFTFTVTAPGIFAVADATASTEVGTVTPFPTGTVPGTGAACGAYVTGTGTAFNVWATGTGTAFYPYATGTGTAVSSGFAACTGVGSAGFIGVPIDNGYVYTDSKRRRSLLSKRWRKDE